MFMCVCVCVWHTLPHMSMHMILLRGPGSSNIPTAMSTLSSQICSYVLFSTKWNQSSLEKWLISGTGQGKYKKNLIHCSINQGGAQK